jgi:hypothetical protein
MDRLLTFFGVERDRDEISPEFIFPMRMAPFIRLDPGGERLNPHGHVRALSEQIEVLLARFEECDAELTESVKAMSDHAFAALDVIFITAKRIQTQWRPADK